MQQKSVRRFCALAKRAPSVPAMPLDAAAARLETLKSRSERVFPQ